MIEIKQLHKYYNKGKNNEIHVINNTTLKLPEKGFVCILGESGSGKTTLLNTLGGLDSFASGEVTVADETMKGFSQDRFDRIRTEHCAYVFQNYYLLSEHTVDYNIRLVLNMYDMTEEEKSKRVDYVLKAVGMLKYKKRQVAQLSGGQQQRVAIARALAKTPKIIFADEPTGNLDEANTMRIMHILKKVSENCLVLMVTHETRLASVFADRVIRVENGCVVSDDAGEKSGQYQYEDDSTIYLKEYQQTQAKENQICIQHYTKEGEAVNPALTLRVIEENGKYYIEALSDTAVTFVVPNSKKQILDEKRPSITEESQDEFVYDLETLECKRMPSLSLKEILRVALQNLKLLGKQQMFLIAAFLTMAVLFVLTVSDILTLNAIDIRSVVSADEKEIIVEVEKNGGFDWTTFGVYFDELFEDSMKVSTIEEVKYFHHPTFTFAYEGFEQIQDIQAILTGYSVENLERFDESTLLYGRMPEKADEIIVDTWVLENFIKKEPSLSQLLPTPDEFLEKELLVGKKAWTVKIVGVCDTNSPMVYIDEFMRFVVSGRFSNKLGNVELLKNAEPEVYNAHKLGHYEMLVSDKYMAHLINREFSTEVLSLSDGLKFKIVGTFSADIGTEMLISHESYEDMLRFVIGESRSWIVSTDNREEVLAYFNNLPETITNNLQVFVSYPYGEQLSKYEAVRAEKLNARIAVTVTIFVVSLILLYFSMKSNAMKKIDDIRVYRLLGIKKSSILMIFALESGLLTLFTSVPAVILTSGVLKFIAGIPSLELNLVYPWSAAFGIVVFLLVMNMLTGVLPVISMVRKPPAQLAE